MIGLLQLLGLAQNRCRACNTFFLGREQGFICDECLGSLKPHHPMDYSQKFEYLFSYRVFGLYNGILKEVIHCIKFHNSKALAHRLGSTIKNHLWEYIREVEPEIITFPSLNIRRLWLRGFNHIEHILTGAEIPCMKVFKRLDLNPPLSTLKKEERKRAVSGHRLREEFIDYIEGKRVLVVDDLLATGSTMRRLAYLLLSVGASEVHAYFVARG